MNVSVLPGGQIRQEGIIKVGRQGWKIASKVRRSLGKIMQGRTSFGLRFTQHGHVYHTGISGGATRDFRHDTQGQEDTHSKTEQGRFPRSRT